MSYYVIGDDKGFEQAYTKQQVDTQITSVNNQISTANSNISTLQNDLNTTNTNVNAKQKKITSDHLPFVNTEYKCHHYFHQMVLLFLM